MAAETFLGVLAHRKPGDIQEDKIARQGSCGEHKYTHARRSHHVPDRQASGDSETSSG